MKKQNILLMMLALTFSFATPAIVMAQQDSSEQISKNQNDKRELIKTHRAEIEKIKNDATLTEDEKEVLIRQKNNELRETLGRGSAGKGNRGKGKFESKEAREEWRMNKKAISKEIDAIENDASLSDEEKELKKRAVLNEKLGEKRRKGKKGGAYKHMDEGERRVLREERKAQLEAIKNDPNLTEEEKAAKKKELINKGKKEGIVKGRKGDMHHGKGHHKHREMTKKEAKEKYGKGSKNDFANQGLSTEQKEKALAALKKNEARLAKELKKGKISKEKYDLRMLKITQVREKILKS